MSRLPSDQRNFTVMVPKLLLERIGARARAHGRTRNAEFRVLLNLGLELANGDEIAMVLDDESEIQTTVRIDKEVHQLLHERSRHLMRGIGSEMVRLVTYAIQVTTDRDLRMLQEMLQQGLAGREPQPLGSLASRPAPPAAQPTA